MIQPDIPYYVKRCVIISVSKPVPAEALFVWLPLALFINQAFEFIPVKVNTI
jgi:hypothetical protein